MNSFYAEFEHVPHYVKVNGPYFLFDEQMNAKYYTLFEIVQGYEEDGFQFISKLNDIFVKIEGFHSKLEFLHTRADLEDINNMC
ncbi:hypothetical protein ES708_01619 [subsurface metagenome]